MTPASIIPHKHAIMLFLKSILNILAASIPVHAPVPGIGIPIKSTSAINNPLPSVSCNFRPALLLFSIQNLKNFPITFLFFPHSSSLCEKRYCKKSKYNRWLTNDIILKISKDKLYLYVPKIYEKYFCNN